MPRFGDPGHPKGGRKTRYRQDLADAICRGIASGRSSGEVCEELGLPRQTVGQWRGAHPAFRAAYIEAFAARCYGFAEEAVEILDACPKDADMARVQRERARAELRKFFASRLVPMLQDVPMVAGATVNVYLPAKGSTDDGMRTIDGVSVSVEQELLTDGSEG